MIVVTHLPANAAFTKTFKTAACFAHWVSQYVCEACLDDFEDFEGRKALTVRDYLSMGCGCESDIEDPNEIINWDMLIEPIGSVEL